MARIDRSLTRRTVLRGTATAGLAAAGLSATALTTGATESECCVCWVDVKPDSCPNSINPDSGGVVSVAAAPPGIDPDTTELVPITRECADSVGFEPAFDECQDYQDQVYAEDCDALRALLDGEAGASDRSAAPVRATREDIDDDGDEDTVFTFDVDALDLRPEDVFLVLTGQATHDDCTVYGVDSVRVLEGSGSNGGGGEGGSQGRGGGR